MTEPVNMNTTPREAVRSMQVLFWALVGGVVLFALTVVLMQLINGPLWEPDNGAQSNILVSVAIIVSITCMLGARSYYAKTVALGSRQLFSLGDKLNQYRAALIIYMALCEGPALFSVIILLLTGKYLVVIITVLLVTMMCLKAPTRNRIIQELKLDWREQQEI
jgi:hypothetical protein